MELPRVDPKRFDIDHYAKVAGKLDLTGIDFKKLGEAGLPERAINCVRYMMDIEGHTAEYARDLLNTAAKNDPESTAFISLWVGEEFFHGEAFSRVLESCGDVVPSEDPRFRIPTRYNRTLALRLAVGQRRLKRALISAASYMIDDFAAVHMSWGAINEITTLTGYHQLIKKTENEEFTKLLTRIIKQERLHYSFYFWKAHAVLSGNRRLQRMTRIVLERFFSPVGVGAKSWEEFYEIADYLLSGEDGTEAARSIDQAIARLPGLSGFHPIHRAMNRRGKWPQGATIMSTY